MCYAQQKLQSRVLNWQHNNEWAITLGVTFLRCIEWTWGALPGVGFDGYTLSQFALNGDAAVKSLLKIGVDIGKFLLQQM